MNYSKMKKAQLIQELKKLQEEKAKPERAQEILQVRLRLMEFAITHSLEEVLQKTLDEVEALTNSPISFYHFVEPDQKTLTLQVWSTRTVQEFCKAEGKGLHYSIDDAGVWVDCIHKKRPVTHNDYASLPNRKGMPPNHAAVIRELVVPIFRNDRIVAILGVGNKQQDYTDNDIEIVSLFADLAWDIAERKQAEKELSKRTVLLDAINKVFQESFTAETDRDVARVCLSVAEELTGSKFGFMCEVNPNGRFDTIAISDTGWETCRIPETNALLMLNDLEIRGIRGNVIKEERPLIFNKPASHPDWIEPPENHPVITCFMGVPLKHGNRTIGMIGLANKDTPYDQQDLHAIESLALSFVEAVMRKRSEQKLRHLNMVLRAIRNINQLIVEEQNRDHLSKAICENLTRNREYPCAWVAALDITGSVVSTGESELADTFPKLLQLLKSGDSIRCVAKALKQADILVTNDTRAECSDCPLSRRYKDTAALTTRLQYGSRTMGVLVVHVPPVYADDPEEHSLLKEVAGDIALAYNRMEQEEARKQAEEALVESEANYRDLYNSSPVACFSIGTDGFIKEANKAAEDLLGYSLEELKKIEVYDIYAEESKAKARRLFDRFTNGGSWENEEMLYERKDGQKVHGLLSVNPVKDKNGKVLESRSIVVNITERKKAEEAKRELEAQKLVVERMKELERMKDEFISTVTHELRTPMTPMKSTIEMLLDGSLGELNDRQEKFIRMMARNVDRLAQFTTEVLTLSRLESGRFKLAQKVLALREALESVMELMQQKAKNKNSTVSFGGDAEISAYADENSLSIVVTNLVNNAIVHNPEGTKITVASRALDENCVELSVTDTGQGIPEDAMENLFDRFYQAKREAGAGYQGTGVGLAVSKALVEAMGGEISVESHVGEGTIFRFTLPVSPPQDEDKEATE